MNTGAGAVTFGSAGTNRTRSALSSAQTWLSNGAGLTFASTGTSSQAFIGLGTNILTIDGSANTSIASIITGTAAGNGMIKNGAGTLTLTGNNTYTGNTTVNAGTLILSSGSLLSFRTGATTETGHNVMSGGGTVTLNGNFLIDTSITDASSLTSGSWQIENVPTLTGAYGASFTVVGWINAGSDKWTKSVGTKNYSFDELTGTVTMTAGNPYTTWAAGYAPADLTNPAGDNDNDGVLNQQEFAFGLSPVSGTSVNPIIGQVNKTTGQFSYQRLAASNLTYKVLTSTTLAGGSWTQDVGAVQVAGATDDNGNQTVLVTLTGAPLAASKLFVRVSAE